MLPDWELRACAHHFVKKHDENAAVIAAMRADELLEARDLEGVRTFQAIIRRINELFAAPTGSLH
jgi:hypothetical protein